MVCLQFCSSTVGQWYPHHFRHHFFKKFFINVLYIYLSLHYINLFISNHIHKQIIHSFPTTSKNKSSIQSENEIKNHYTIKTIEVNCSQSNYNNIYIYKWCLPYVAKMKSSSSRTTKNVFLPPISYLHKYKEKYINTISTRKSNYWYN